jgi:homoserine kinase type II
VAVYTQLGAEALAELIAAFDVGALRSAKGIAEGVSNSNWLIETTGRDGGGARFILTMYEHRVEVDDLPFFLGLLDHLAERACPVPRTIHDRDDQPFRFVDGKAVALIEFLPGVSVSKPTAAQALAVGAALAQVHAAAADFPKRRENDLGPDGWRSLAASCDAARLAEIDPGLPGLIGRELELIARDWPRDLPQGVIHADLFPDNVLMIDDAVTGLIDFYFACTDILAYDVAVTHTAWCFSADGRRFDPELSRALLAGYQSVRPLSPAEHRALPLLASGAALRFLLTRAYDWMNTPAGALVTRKDPLAFARRLEFYADPDNAGVFESPASGTAAA